MEPSDEHTILLEKLTPREKEVLVVLASGKISKEIADVLNISVLTVEKHKQNIRQKLNMVTIGELINFTLTSRLYVLE